MKSQGTLSLIFDWPARHAVHLALPLMLGVSILAHVAGLAFFQLKPLRENQMDQRSAGVYFLVPDQPGAARMQAAIAAMDPALFSAAASESRDIWRLPEIEYAPSFDAIRPDFVDLLPPQPNSAGIRIEPLRQPGVPSSQPAEPPIPTRIQWTGDLTGASLQLPAEFVFSAPARQNLSPLEMLVAVSAEGTVLHVFPLNTSGNEAVDGSAVQAIFRGKLSPPATDTTLWGTATFLWGADVQRISRQ